MVSIAGCCWLPGKAAEFWPSLFNSLVAELNAPRLRAAADAKAAAAKAAAAAITLNKGNSQPRTDAKGGKKREPGERGRSRSRSPSARATATAGETKQQGKKNTAGAGGAGSAGSASALARAEAAASRVRWKTAFAARYGEFTNKVWRDPEFVDPVGATSCAPSSPLVLGVVWCGVAAERAVDGRIYRVAVAHYRIHAAGRFALLVYPAALPLVLSLHSRCVCLRLVSLRYANWLKLIQWAALFAPT